MANNKSFFTSVRDTMAGFGFMRRLGSHQTVSDKFNSKVYNNKFVNQKDFITPPEATPEKTTAFGEYFHTKGSVRVDHFMASLSSYFKTDVNDLSHKQAIERYRSISMYPEVSDAIDEYVNSIIVHNIENPDVIKIDYKDPFLFTDKLKDVINDEFSYLLNLLDFENSGERIVSQFIVDGCIPIEKVFDENYVSRGIIDINILDAAYMTKTVVFENDPYTKLKREIERYYIFTYPTAQQQQYNINEVPFASYQINAGYKLQIPDFLVSYIDSGKHHPIRHFPMSVLHKALKVANQLKILEDSILIYRITRAPERRVFYVDVGNLPPAKAEEHIEELIRQYRTEKSYDPSTGSLKADADIMAMVEDFWLPRRNGQAATEVSTLSGAQNLGEITDLDFFYKKLWRALGVPYSRRVAKTEGGIGHNHTADITADELAFYKTIRFLRRRIEFGLFKDLLRTHLVAKNIVGGDHIEDVLANIKFIWNEDTNFSELVKFEVMQARFDMVNNMGLNISDFISKPWVAKNILKFTDEEIKQLTHERKYPEKYGFDDDEIEGDEDRGYGGGGFGGDYYSDSGYDDFDDYGDFEEGPYEPDLDEFPDEF